MSERWLPVLGYEGFYEISDRGRVRSVPRIDIRKVPRGGKLMIWQMDRRTGYWQVKLCKDGKARCLYVHSLVLEAFVSPRPPGLETLHADDDRANPCLGNLSWGTRKENMATRNVQGSRNGYAVLDETKVRKIKGLIGTKSGVEIARLFGVNKATVYDIAKGRSWVHVT